MKIIPAHFRYKYLFYLDNSRRRHLVYVIEELDRIPVRRVLEHRDIEEGRSPTNWLLDPLHLNPVDDVPEDLLGPGGPTLGVGHHPDVVLPHLHVVHQLCVVEEPLSDGL